MRCKWFVTVLVFALLGVVVPRAEAIIGGAPDSSRHPYVGFLSFSGGGFCSGSLVSPTVFVTAAHCGDEGDRVGVSVNDQIYSTTALTPGTFHELPGACDGCGNGLPKFMSRDLAVVKLDTPVTVARYGQLPSVDRSLTLRKGPVDDVGYGVNGFDRGGGTPVQRVEYNRSVATLTLSGANDTISDSFLKVSAQNPKGAFCFGDSGGPVLQGDTILGVNSFLNGVCTASAYAYRIDTTESLAFIASFN